ncbi:pseudouridylate synthase, partial [Pseudomonas sp. MWU13-2860]
IGDATHGKGRHNRMFTEHFGSQRLLLACVAMQLSHPDSGQPLLLQAPPADDFMQVMEQLGWRAALEDALRGHAESGTIRS